MPKINTFYEEDHNRRLLSFVVRTKKHNITVPFDIDWELKRIENLRSNGVCPRTDMSDRND